MNIQVGSSAGADAEEWLQRAFRSYHDSKDIAITLIPRMSEVLAHYDVPGIDRSVNICFWSRSGSFLLASYLDHHPEILMLPMICSQSIYPFLVDFESLTIWDKLIVYPAYSEWKCAAEGSLFNGEYPIAAVNYFAAVSSLFAAYGDRSAVWLNSSRRFFQFLHVAHAVALQRRPGVPRPLIVYAQHWTNEDLARRFIQDFPSGQFIHTIRDPISALDSWFDRQLELQTRPSPKFSTRYVDAAVSTVSDLLRWNCAHQGMEERTRAIRFEDLHLAPEATMRRLADWIDVTYRSCLLESTFNGVPYVNQSSAGTWVGSSPKNAHRRSRNLNAADQSMIFAVLYENFRAWNYSCPEIFAHTRLRLLTLLVHWLKPMKMEMICARVIIRQQALPAWRAGRIIFACRATYFLLSRRLRMMWLIAAETRAHLMSERRFLRLL